MMPNDRKASQLGKQTFTHMHSEHCLEHKRTQREESTNQDRLTLFPEQIGFKARLEACSIPTEWRDKR